jgi:hypothetical protein
VIVVKYQSGGIDEPVAIFDVEKVAWQLLPSTDPMFDTQKLFRLDIRGKAANFCGDQY